MKLTSELQMSVQEIDGPVARKAPVASGAEPGDCSAMLVSALNASLANIPLAEIRVNELPTEINQLRAAALANRARQQFDLEPANFASTLALHKKAGK